MRLIDADALLDGLGRKKDPELICPSMESFYENIISDMIDLINDAPTIETHEIRTDTGGVCSDLVYRPYATVIRAKTLMSKEDFDKWAEDLKRQNKNIVCIPCDAEVVSADAVQGWNKGKPTEQGRYMVTLDSFGYKYINLFHYGKPLMPNRKVKGVCWYRSDDEWGDVVYDDKNIIAWMPLPKPYKGGNSE